MSTVYLRVKPVPSCPKCGAVMRLRWPKPGDEWSPFFGCNRYPDCDGTRRPVNKAEGQETFWEERDIEYRVWRKP